MERVETKYDVLDEAYENIVTRDPERRALAIRRAIRDVGKRKAEDPEVKLADEELRAELWRMLVKTENEYNA